MEELSAFQPGLVVLTCVPELLQPLEHGLAGLPIVGEVEDRSLGELLGDAVKSIGTEQAQHFLGRHEAVASVGSEVLAPL